MRVSPRKLTWLVALTKEDIGRLANFANQFDVSLRVLFYRMALGRFPNLRREPVFSAALLTLQEYM